MATITSAATVTIPSFTGLKATVSATSKPVSVRAAAAAPPKLVVRASLKDVGVAVVATAASVMLASNAMALDILLGSDDGSLVFIPKDADAAAGEKINFLNNAGFPHNVVFDEDAVPSGVDAGKISMNEEDLLNAKGETYAVTLTEKGTYGYYCYPHQGAGMVGTITIK